MLLLWGTATHLSQVQHKHGTYERVETMATCRFFAGKNLNSSGSVEYVVESESGTEELYNVLGDGGKSSGDVKAVQEVDQHDRSLYIYIDNHGFEGNF